MCQVTKNLKLCTCQSDDVSQLRNYWLYNRFVIGRQDFIIGEICMVLDLEHSLSISNKKRITRMLNAGTCFDVYITPQEKDQLHLYFTTGFKSNDKQEICYSFKFYKSRWHSINSGSLIMFWHHETFLKGEIGNGLTKNVESRDLIEKIV